MANIKLKDLSIIVGIDLFSDSENFMQELSESELELQGGGRLPTPIIIGTAPILVPPSTAS
jgi:hypothetical protein